MELKITSPAFVNGGNVPDKYTCDGEDINPELNIEGVPKETQTLVLICDDPDAPAGTWTHWVVFNIPPTTTKIEENSIPGTQGMNDFKKVEWGGPCPPGGKHRYFFKVYALDIQLDLGEGAMLTDVTASMKDHVLAQGELMGTYSRS